MTKRSRYLLLLVGFIIFLMGAPLIVMYVRGLAFDPETGKLINTGILAVRADPDQSEIYVNGELKRKKTGDIKFLKPGEYTVTIKHDGYFDWSKRLSIRPNEVTWAQGASDKIHLIYQDGLPKLLAEKVTDFYVAGDNLTYASADSIITASVSEAGNLNSTQAPGPVTSIIAAPSGNAFLVTTASSSTPAYSVFNRNTHTLSVLGDLVSSGAEFAFSNSDDVFALDEGVLYRLNMRDLTKQVLLRNVYTFTLHEDSIYYTKLTAEGTVLAVSNLNGQNEQVIMPGVPLFTEARIVVNYQKEIFLVADGELFKVSSKLDRLASGISAWDFDFKNSSLVLVHSGELSYYNTFDHRLSLITRSGGSITSPLAFNGINHAFFIKDGQVVAMEMDNHGQQNQNLLYTSHNSKKIQASDDLKKLYILDGDLLKELRIR